MASGQCSKWWQLRTNLEKTLISLTVILLLTSVIFIIVGVVSRGGGNSQEATPVASNCLTRQCVETAGTKMSLMDLDIDPCEDFYTFACGRYEKAQAVASYSVRDSAMEAVRVKLKSWLESTIGNNISIYNKAKALYKSCTEAEPAANGQEVIQKALTDAKIGSWPVLDSFWSDDTDVERTLASLIQLGINVAFEFQVTRDVSDVGKQLLRIQPSHQPFSANDKDLHALRTYALSTLLQLDIPMSRAVEAADDIVSTEAEFNKAIKLANEQCGDLTDDETGSLRSVIAENVQRVNYYVPELDWNKLWNFLYKENKVFQATKNFTFDVYCRKYIRDLTERLVHFSPKTVFNYLGWKFLFPLIPHLGEPFRRLQWSYQSATSTTPQEVNAYPQKWEHCFSLHNHHMLPVLLTAYREYEIPEEALDQKVKIATALRSTLVRLLSNAEWLDEYEKDLLKNKVMASRFRLALTEVASKIRELDDFYDELHVGDEILFNVLNISRFEATKRFERMLSLTSGSDLHSKWRSTSLTSKSLEHADNVIAVHFDKIGPPYLYLSQPRYLTFGALGTYLSHDLLKYISEINLMEKVRGNKTLWEVWRTRDKSKTCQNELKLNFSIPKEEALNVLNSAMNELNSISVSYQTYRSLLDEDDDEMLPALDYSSVQLFFLSYAQSLCGTADDEDLISWGQNRSPVFKHRVNTVLKHFKAFSDAYNCQSGSAMNLPPQCQVFTNGS